MEKKRKTTFDEVWDSLSKAIDSRSSPTSSDTYLASIIYAFLDVTDGMKPHDYFAHMGGTQERADEVAAIRDGVFKTFGKAWLASKRRR